MDYTKRLKHHYQPQKGWINDPNGLVYFKGYYHIFYQHSPNHEKPWFEPMYWGHARTKDFITFEELPIAIAPDMPYDKTGCWSGTAIVKDDTLYLFYASVRKDDGAPAWDDNGRVESVSMAFSKDGINFEKYEGNPVIKTYPVDGGHNFRDPAVMEKDGKFYLVMATGQPENKVGRLLCYESENLTDWQYKGILKEWQHARYAECPSFLKYGDEFMLCASYVNSDDSNPDDFHHFAIMTGDFDGKAFTEKLSGEVDMGPDQYAGQAFTDDKGRNILIAWVPGWSYQWDKCIGCMSLPRELTVKDGKIYGYPVKEVQHLLKDSDPALIRTEKGFMIEREGRNPVIFEGEINDLKILREEYIIEVFINGGEKIYTAVL